VIIAILVPNIIALENPCKILKIISETILPEKIIIKVEMVNSKIPIEKIFFLPIISPSRPKGKRKMADVKIKLLITQLRLIAFACSSFPMEGKARLTAEVRNGVRKAAKVDTSSTDFLKLFSSVISAFMGVFFITKFFICLHFLPPPP
jgi:hypothetical protein